MLGEREGRVNQETRCLVLHANVYGCGVDDDVYNILDCRLLSDSHFKTLHRVTLHSTSLLVITLHDVNLNRSGSFDIGYGVLDDATSSEGR